MAQLRPGAWVKIRISQPNSSSSGAWLPCWHHGIVTEVSGPCAKIIHFSLPEKATDAKVRVVRETSLEWFLAGGTDAEVVDAEPNYTYEEVVDRALSYVGSTGYRLPTRNCEHFASWCYLGSAFSRQVFAFGVGCGVTAVVFGVIAVAAMGMSRSRWAP